MIKAWIAGDCWLKQGIGPIDLARVWGGCRPAVFVVNLECSVPAGPARPGRRALLPLDARRLPELGLGQNTICMLANNHVTDYGPAGVLATLDEVRRAGFQTLGAGATLNEARKPVIVNVRGCRIGLLAYADTSSGVGAVAASDHAPGVAPLSRDMVIRDLQRLAGRVDDPWLFLHWGREYLRYPEPEQRSLAQAFAEAGAKLIVGTHPHVLRGWERLADTLVYYSLGNFVFPPIPLADGPLLRWDRENRQGIALRGSLDVNGWVWAHVPYVMSAEGKPEPAPYREQQSMMRKVASLAEVLDHEYARRYSRIQRREIILRTIRRFSMMTWVERLRLPGRLIRTARLRVRAQTSQ